MCLALVCWVWQRASGLCVIDGTGTIDGFLGVGHVWSDTSRRCMSRGNRKGEGVNFTGEGVNVCGERVGMAVMFCFQA